MDVQLLLTRADTLEPVLPEGLSRDAALQAAAGPAAETPASKRPQDDGDLADPGADPDVLKLQRWGLVVPRGDHGRELLRAVEPLRRRRAEQQGTEDVVIYEVDPDMTAADTDGWISGDYLARVNRHIEELPRYLLILGGPDRVSWAMQQQLSTVAMVGRLAFHDAAGRPDIPGYEAYVRKVLRWEDAGGPREPKALFYAVGGTKPTDDAREQLLQPNLAVLREAGSVRDLRAIGVEGPPPYCTDDLKSAREAMESAVREESMVFFSVSHGVGGTWQSAEEQRTRQGTPKMGERLLGAEDVAKGPFLPGGAWIFFACFSAGTPRESLYRTWVGRLHAMKELVLAPEGMVLSAPKDGVPFVAAVPQAALRNEDGPLGIVGHVDLALWFNFRRHDFTQAHTGVTPRPERFAGLLKSMLLGRRLGVAFDSLAGEVRNIDAALVSRYQAAEEASDARGREAAPDPAGAERDERASLAELWLERQDLRSFVLLGDPAARLPLRGDGARASTSGQPSVRIMEEAVLRRLREESLPDIAKSLGVEETDIEAWVETYQAAGREALSALKG